MPLPAFAEKRMQEAEERVLNTVLPAPSVTTGGSFRERPECMDFPSRAPLALSTQALQPTVHQAEFSEELLPLPLPSINGLTCPLCHKTFEDPVMTVDGHSFCRRCIQDWFVQHAQKPGAAPLPNSPVSGQPLLSKLLMPNVAIGKVLTSMRENMRPAWMQAEQERESLRQELQQRTAELMQVKTSTEGQSKELNDAELKAATLTVKLQMTEEEARAARGEVERLNGEISGLREKLERFQAQIAGERSSVQQIEELDSQLRFASGEVQRLQSELETVKKQERALQKGKAKESSELGKVLQEKQKMQEELIRLRSQLQHREAIPSAVVLAEELENARRDVEAKDLQIRDLQLVGTRMGSQLIEASEKQRQGELMLRRVPEMEAENQQLRTDLSQKVAELAEVEERVSKLEDQLRRREEAAPELTAAELLATEAERLEEELSDAYAKCATIQAEVKRREDLLRGIPLVLADFLEQIHLPDPDLTSAGARPEDAPRLVIAALQKLQAAVAKREAELKAANEKIAELCKYGAKRDEEVQREAYDALRVELLDVSKRCADAEAKLRELGVEEATAAGQSALITKMSMLIYQLQVCVLSGTGLRAKNWRPGPDSEALSCAVAVVGKEETKFLTKQVRDAKNPAWNHTDELQMSHSDSLRFVVQGTKGGALGKADLPASRLIAAGFEGELALEESPQSLAEMDPSLKVKVTVLNSFLATGSDSPMPAALAKGGKDPSRSSAGRTDSDSYSWDSSGEESSSASAPAMRDLFRHAKAGDLRQVRQLLGRASPREVATLGTDALHAACSEGHKEIVKVLCEAKTKLNAKDNNGLTPLHVAAFRGDDAVVQILCRAKADVHATDEEGWTPLYVVASFSGQADVARTLLHAKSDVNFTTTNGTSVAAAAKQKGFNDLLQLLKSEEKS